MSEFLLVFRRDFKTKEAQPTPEQFQEHVSHWGVWFTKLKSEDRLVAPPHRFDGAGKILKQDKTVADGPYLEAKESIGGLIIIRADSYEEAIKIAEGCPVLELGGNVEVRQAL
jgi:hypothetical protein